MKYKYILGLLLPLTSLSNPSHADTSFGIGAAINDQLTVFFPIKTDGLLIEPTIALYSSDNKQESSSGNSNYDFKTLSATIGVFKKDNTYKNTFIYYGARLGYTRRESNNSFSDSGFNSNYSSKTDGYIFSPTLGAEYMLTNQFSIGLEIAYNYSKLTGDGDDTQAITNGNFQTNTDISETNTSTSATAIIRYYF